MGQQSKLIMRLLTNLLRAALFGVVAVSIALPVVVEAQSNGNREEERGERRRAESLDPRVARDLLPAYEMLQNDQFPEALTALDALVNRLGSSMKPFDLASVLQIRGSALVNLERYADAIRDFERAIQLDALPPEQNDQLLFNVAQLYFQQERYRESISTFERWLKYAEAPDANVYFMLAAAHYYLDEYSKARPHAERAKQLAAEPDKRHFDLLNILYSELNLPAQRTKLLQEIISIWPSDPSYWKQLAAIHMEQGRERDAFTTLELAYKSGLIDGEQDIVSLAQFYSVFNNPFRGGQMLEEEMKKGRVERSTKNLELLSQLWSQAREHRRAIPVLEEAARSSDSGMLSYRLGQVLLSDENNADAEKAFEAAIRKGDLSESARSDVWMLLGTARFNQAGPGDRAKRNEADQAFASAERFAVTRTRAKEWREYITAINDTEDRQAALERQQQESLAEAARQRELSYCRTQQISGQGVSEECEQLLLEEQERQLEERRNPTGN